MRVTHVLRGVIALGCVCSIAACSVAEPAATGEEQTTERPNPAAEFCVEQGGEYVIESGQCRLGDGTTVDAWEYYREHHSEATP